MVQLELKYSTGTEIVNVPTKWDDVTFEKYAELLKLENEPDQIFEDRIKNRFQVFLGIDSDNYMRLQASAVDSISTLLMFSFDFEELNKYYNVPAEMEGFDVGEQEWQKLIECQIYMKPIYAKYPVNDEMTLEEKEAISAKILLEMYIIGDKFVKALTGKDISKEKLTDVYWMPAFFLAKCYNFFQNSQMMRVMMGVSSQIYTKD